MLKYNKNFVLKTKILIINHLNKIIIRNSSKEAMKLMATQTAKRGINNVKKPVVNNFCNKDNSNGHSCTAKDFQIGTVRLFKNDPVEHKPLLIFGKATDSGTTTTAMILSRVKFSKDTLKMSNKTIASDEKRAQYINQLVKSRQNKGKSFIETAEDTGLPGTQATKIESVKKNLLEETKRAQEILHNNPNLLIAVCKKKENKNFVYLEDI